MKQIYGREFSRREFLALSAMTTGGLVLAACGAPTTTTPAGLAGKPIENALNIYNWSAYLNPATLTQFKAAHPTMSVRQDTYASNEDMLAKIEAGAKGYDIVVPTGYMVKIMIAKNLLYPIDHSLLTNYSHIDARFTQSGYDFGNKYSIPKDWGTTGFGFRKDKVKQGMTSWKDFFEMAPSFSGKISVLDGANEVIGSTLKYLGHSYNSDNDQELSAAKDALLKFKPHVGHIQSVNYKEQLASGDLAYSMGWNGDFAAILALTPAPPVQYVIPSEGSEYWVDTWAVLKTAPDPVAAHAFINFILDPKIQGQEANYTYYANPESDATPFITNGIPKDPTVYPTQTVLSNLESNKPTAKGQRMRDQIFAEFKAA
jgi:spermidine/putrescine transport system substrate-binding protein